MTDDVLKAVEPMPNDTVIDLTGVDSTPKKRKAEGELRETWPDANCSG